MAWRKEQPDIFPAPLREFREQDWPAVAGECLEDYACRGNGYDGPCVPRPGEACGQAHFEYLAREHPDRPDLVARATRRHAFMRYSLARQSWLGEDHPDYVGELINSWSDPDGLA